MNDDEDAAANPPHFQDVAVEMTGKDDVELSTDGRGSGALTTKTHRSLSMGVRVGPLPSPEDLAAYEKGCPGMGMAIIDLAKTEQANRHEREMIVRKSDAKVRERSQITGTAIILSAIVAGTVLLSVGVPVAGTISLITGALSALASAGRNRRVQQQAPAPQPPAAPSAQPASGETSREIAIRPKTNA